MRKSLVFTGAAVGCLAAAWICLTPHDGADALAQSGGAKSKANRRPNVASVRQLDLRAEKLQEELVQQVAELAREYEDAGELERAKEFLEQIQSFNPNLPGVSQKIKQLDEVLLSSNELTVEVDTSKGWGNPIATVSKDKPIRFQASGSYRFVTNLTVGPEGFPTEDPTKEMAPGISCGALMGLVVSQGKPGKPFAIQAGTEFTPKEDGILFLSVNIPPGSKCTGRLRVTMTGFLGRN